jgi:hypothetical protein
VKGLIFHLHQPSFGILIITFLSLQLLNANAGFSLPGFRCGFYGDLIRYVLVCLLLDVPSTDFKLHFGIQLPLPGTTLRF